MPYTNNSDIGQIIDLYTCNTESHTLASFCSWAGRLETYLVAQLQRQIRMFSNDVAQLPGVQRLARAEQNENMIVMIPVVQLKNTVWSRVAVYSILI